jgi:transcriptional regulator with XRE-family HTH domain
MPAHYLREWLDKIDITLEQAADQTGLSVSAISRIATGKRPIREDHIIKLAKGFELEPADLFRHPDERREVDDLWRQLTDDERRGAIAYMETVLSQRAKKWATVYDRPATQVAEPPQASLERDGDQKRGTS